MPVEVQNGASQQEGACDIARKNIGMKNQSGFTHAFLHMGIILVLSMVGLDAHQDSTHLNLLSHAQQDHSHPIPAESQLGEPAVDCFDYEQKALLDVALSRSYIHLRSFEKQVFTVPASVILPPWPYPPERLAAAQAVS